MSLLVKCLFAILMFTAGSAFAAQSTTSLHSVDQTLNVSVNYAYYNWGRAQNGFGFCYQWAGNGQVLNGVAPNSTSRIPAQETGTLPRRNAAKYQRQNRGVDEVQRWSERPGSNRHPIAGLAGFKPGASTNLRHFPCATLTMVGQMGVESTYAYSMWDCHECHSTNGRKT